MKKIQIQQKQFIIHTFRRDQIETGDVREFLTQYDPFRLSNNRVGELFENLSLDFEGVEKGAVSTHRQVRVLLRRLHAIWPWSGFFMNLSQPMGPSNRINDLPLLALGLSLSDLTWCRWEATQQSQLKVGPQLQIFSGICHDVVNRLGKRAQFSPEILQARHEAVTRQFNHVLK